MKTNDDIEHYVGQLLEVAGIVEGEQPVSRVRTLLGHLYVAVAMYEHATDEERQLISFMQKKLRYFFSANCYLKELKRKGKRKENLSPLHPSIKEKPTPQEKPQKTPSPRVCEEVSDLEKRQWAFWQELLKYEQKYGRDMILKFYYYWGEEVKETGRMLFETKRSWNTKMRLAAWSKKPYEAEAKAAAIRLQRAKGRQQAAGQAAPGQDAKREDANDRLFRQIEENKQKAVSHEEWLRMKKGNENNAEQ